MLELKWQIVQTTIRLLSTEQSDLGLQYFLRPICPKYNVNVLYKEVMMYAGLNIKMPLISALSVWTLSSLFKIISKYHTYIMKMCFSPVVLTILSLSLLSLESGLVHSTFEKGKEKSHTINSPEVLIYFCLLS